MNIGDTHISALFCGNMGIKKAVVSDATVYTRPGGYFYIELETNQNNTNQNIKEENENG